MRERCVSFEWTNEYKKSLWSGRFHVDVSRIRDERRRAPTLQGLCFDYNVGFPTLAAVRGVNHNPCSSELLA